MIYELKLFCCRLHTAVMTTLFGTTGTFLVCFAASRNMAPRGYLCMICRRLLEIARTVPEFVFGPIFVYAFGFGSLPGVLAIMVHSVGARGIGHELYTVIRQSIYVDISAIVVLLILTVALIDITCEQLLRRLIG
jgi:ABC-type phosphate/phosphonate transport system permease subunit